MNIKKLAVVTALSFFVAGASASAHEEGTAMMATSGTAKTMKAKKKLKKMAAPKKKIAAVKEHWVCPMHDGGESDHAGHCSKCGMDLVLEK